MSSAKPETQSRPIGEAAIHQRADFGDSEFFVMGPVAAFGESQNKMQSIHLRAKAMATRRLSEIEKFCWLP